VSDEGVKIPLGYADIPSHKLFACDPPKQIYHYTDFNGVSGIIESKSLWLTKLSYLNDKSELTLAIDLFRSQAASWANKIGDGEKAKFLRDASHQLQSFSNTNICVASFCEDGDLLSQWRSYGNDGSGVAIEFDAHSLTSLSRPAPMNLWKCVYSREEQQTVVEGLIEILLRSYDVVGATRTTNWENTKKDIIGYFNTTFLTVAPVIKNYHFSEEREWRIITASMPFTDDNWFSRVSNNRVAQYYKLRFDLVDNGKYGFVNGVIVGPTREPTQVAEAISVLMHKNGYCHKHVGHSQIPYRS